MIETNILDWIDLGEKLETLEIFKNKKNQYLFRFFSGLRKFSKHGLLFHLILKILFFLQIMCLDSYFIEKSDYFTNIFSILRPYVFFVDGINNKNNYILAFILSCILVWSLVILSTIILIQLSCKIIPLKFLYILLDTINTLFKEILIGPLIWIILLVFKCVDGSHIYFQTACYSSSDHLAILLISLLNLILITAIIYLISIFSSQCGSIKDIRILNSLNSHYEILSSSVKVTIFIFAFFVKNYETNSDLLKIIFCLYVFIICFLISYYTYKHALFYNEILNKTILYGWCVVTWYSLIVFFQTSLKINDILIILIIGLLILFVIIEYFQNRRSEFLLMKDKSNTNNQKSLKEIELFKIKMLDLLNQKTDNQKVILLGITRIFKDNLNKNAEIEEKFKRLLQNEHLKQKFNNVKALEILAQIFIEYHSNLEKSREKNEILINLCYFLINIMKNFTYVSYLISKSKAMTLKQKYQKFILIEEIKEYMLLKLNNSQKTKRSDDIKNVQISSVILFESYCDILRKKINETIYQRVDYFEMMTTRIGLGNSNLSLKNFFELGDKILEKTRDIQKIVSLIRDINPFDEDIFNHYHYYLNIINRDYKLEIEEKKKLNEVRLARLSERGNIYFSLFETNSNIILVDGFNNKSNIIYANKNFFLNFKTNQGELLSKTIHDLVPTAIKDFHEEIIENGIKYSNLSYVFNKQRMLLLKNSKGILHSVKIYIKSIPNLKHGLIYIVSLIKIEDQSGIIVLDSDMNVDGLTDFFSQEMIDLYVNKNKRGVDNNITALTDRHISMIIPETANHIRYNPKTGKFFFINETSEFKGTICNVEKSEMIVNLLKELMEMIKQNSLTEYEFRKNPKNLEKMENSKTIDGKLINLKTSQNYNETLTTFINAVKENSKRVFKVFFKINTKSFIGNKYQYHKIILHKDLSGNGDDFIYNEKMKSLASSSNLYQNNNLNYIEPSKHEIKLKLANRPQASVSNNIENLNLDNLLDSKLGKMGNTIENQRDPNKNLRRDKNLSVSRSTKFSSTSSDLASLFSLKVLLKNQDISIFRHMKYLAIFYALASLFFYIYFYEANTIKKYNKLNSNLIQSKFFNNSKLLVSQIYYYTLNTKMYLSNFYENHNCYNSDCEEFYTNQIDKSISHLNELNTNSTFFNQQFRDILFKQKDVELEIFMQNMKKTKTNNNLKKLETVTLSYKNLVDLIISYSLNLKNFLLTSNSYSDSSLIFNANQEMTIENILNQCYSYLTNEEIFINSNSIDNMAILENYSQLFVVLCILKICLNFFILSIFFYFSYSIYNLEKTHLSILINFKNQHFMEYLKYLSEEWKKISQNYELEIQKKEEEDNFDSNEINSRNGKNKKEKSIDVDNKNFLKNESASIIARNNPDKNNNKNSSQNSQKLKSKNGKKIALKKKKKFEEVENKIFAIKRYFAKFHTYVFLKVFCIILISLSYLAIITLIDKQKILQIMELDSKLDQLYDVYLRSNSIYFQVKTNLAEVVAKEMKKNKAIDDYMLNYPYVNNPIEFDGVVYENTEDLKKSVTYQLKFPTITTNSQINALFNLITIDQENLDLSNLYFGNACEILYNNGNNPQLKTFCENFWFGVLTKGFEQSLTKLNSIYTGIAEDFKYANFDETNFKQLFSPNSNFQLYQDFMEIFFFDSFVKTNELFFAIKEKIPYEIDSLYVKILVLYVILLMILTILNLSIILYSKKSFNSLMNYIYIIPAEFIVTDVNLHSEVLKLEKIF